MTTTPKPAPYRNPLCVLVRGSFDDDDWVLKLSRQKAGGEIPEEFVEFVKSVLPNGKVAVPPLKMEAFSTRRPEELAQELREFIDQEFQAGNYDGVILMPFSAGAPILRYALMKAYGVDESGTIDPDRASAWAKGETSIRVVNLAGILRGWEFSTAMPAHIRFFGPTLSLLMHVVCWLKDGKRPFLFNLKRGSQFIVTGQLMQLALRDSNGGKKLPFELINFLGTRDEFISPADCVELNGSDSSIFVEIDATNHLEMLGVASKESERDLDPAKRHIRRSYFRRAIVEDFAEMASDRGFAIDDDDINDYFDELDRPNSRASLEVNRRVKQAVLVVHGIRDNGYWTKRVARQLKKSEEMRPLLRAPSPSYGFFSLLDFVWKPTRTHQARWLLEQYVEIRECYPSAAISFVGHSNGTYLAKSALEQCPAVQFERIVFAGSVVRTDVKWSELQGTVREGILNLVGDKDGVVALLPGAWEKLGLKQFDVGGAGFYGLRKHVNDPPIQNVQVKGGHGAGISEQNWELIADFIKGSGKTEVTPEVEPVDTGRFGKAAPYFSLLGLFVGAALLCILVWWIGTDGFLSAVLLLALLWGLSKVLRQF